VEVPEWAAEPDTMAGAGAMAAAAGPGSASAPSASGDAGSTAATPAPMESLPAPPHRMEVVRVKLALDG
jgi:hypothetical protein